MEDIMRQGHIDEGDTIAAIATGRASGAIAIIRVSGPGSSGVLQKTFRGANLSAGEMIPMRLYKGDMLADDGRVLDECLAALWRAPRSYTGEDMAEIYCHGGLFLTEVLLGRVLEAGARAALPGEFTMRAFLNGKMDLSHAEAVAELIASEHVFSARYSAARLKGAAADRFTALEDELTALIAAVEVGVDFPDDETGISGADLLERLLSLRARLDDWLSESEAGRVFRDGFTAVLIGAPNSGKSSLLNALLGRDRAIVDDRPGTTRDTVEGVLLLDGLPVRIIDTAGIRQAEEGAEYMGIERARAAAAAADLSLVVLDSAAPMPAGLAEYLAGERVLAVLNKRDLCESPAFSDKIACPRLSVSALLGSNIESLKELIRAAAIPATDLSEGVIMSKRQHGEVVRAREAISAAIDTLREGFEADIAAADLLDALAHIGKLTGKTATDEVIKSIFSQFCVGK